MEHVQGAVARSDPGTREVARLVLSYQRYAALVIGIILGLSWLASFVGTTWAWGLAIVLAVPLGWFGTLVALRLPHKLRLTRAQDARIRRGKFNPDDLLPWVEDPCYRVVAREILVRAGRDPAAARIEVTELARRASAHEGFVFYSKPSSTDGANTPNASGQDGPDSGALDQEEMT
jgi:hypothetical protein